MIITTRTEFNIDMWGKPFMLDYYLTLFGLELSLPDGVKPLTKEESDEYWKTFKIRIK